MSGLKNTGPRQRALSTSDGAPPSVKKAMGSEGRLVRSASARSVPSPSPSWRSKNRAHQTVAIDDARRLDGAGFADLEAIAREAGHQGAPYQSGVVDDQNGGHIAGPTPACAHHTPNQMEALC